MNAQPHAIDLIPFARRHHRSVVRWVHSIRADERANGVAYNAIGYVSQLNGMEHEPDTWTIRHHTGRCIGFVSISDRGRVWIAIGDPAYWGHGYGTLALTRACQRWQMTHPEGIISLTVNSDNARAIRSYQKCSFVMDDGPHAGVRLMTLATWQLATDGGAR